MEQEMKLSQWHDGSVNPVHKGVYKRRYMNGESFCRFENGQWYFRNYTIEGALREGVVSTFIGPWRGIVK